MGYQLLARSPGISQDDARALATWGPSHDALGESADPESLNFFPLPSGGYCLARTDLAGAEYSGRGGGQVYTQMLVIDRAGFARFASNPLALYSAAVAQGLFEVRDHLPEHLSPLELVGRATPLDRQVVSEVVQQHGLAWFTRLVEALIANQPLGILGVTSPRVVLNAVLNCLPVECRGEVSFTTALRFSPRRPFRVTFLAPDLIEARRLSRAYDLNLLLAYDEGMSQSEPTQGWAGLLGQLLAQNDWDLLRKFVSNAPQAQRLDSLNDWGSQLRADRLPAAAGAGLGLAALKRESNIGADSPRAAQALSGSRRADASHRRRSSDEIDEERLAQASRVLAELARDPADILGAEHPDCTAQLEQLDDTVFEAIAGRPQALDHLRQLWPEVLARLGDRMVEESRLQYIRHALTVWKGCVDGDEIRHTAQAVRALEVLCLLFDDHEGAAAAVATAEARQPADCPPPAAPSSDNSGP